MKATTEMEIKVSGGRILEAEVALNGVCKLIVEVDAISKETTINEVVSATEAVNKDDIFVLVEASKLAWTDEFMSYKPTTNEEEKLKKLLTEAIIKGLKDFYRPVIDPSFNRYGGICYLEGNKPAVNKSYNWWEKSAIEFMPERGSRLGTKTEYVAFLGVLLKKLVKSGWSMDKAWNAVCNDSRKLGHYWNSENAKHEFEPTCSREIVGFFDIANTFKILAEDEEAGGFWRAGGYYNLDSCWFPLADLDHCSNRKYVDNYCTGWLVLEK